jgi:adenosylcobinamide-phosphate synthase
LGRAAEIWLAASCLATRNLLDEARAVVQALEHSDLDAARRQLARIVGRDTADLNRNEIARAVTETLAESLSDGVIAPLFYLALGGVPLAMA